MALPSSVVSETANMPEWRSKLVAILEPERSGSQRNLINSLEKLDHLHKELKNDPDYSAQDPLPVLEICAGLAEISFLGVTKYTGFDVNHEKYAFVVNTFSKTARSLRKEFGESIIKYSQASNGKVDSAELPMLLAAMLYKIFGDNSIARELFNFRNTSVSEYISSPTDYYQTLNRFTSVEWRGVNAKLGELCSAGDALLKQVGSQLTIEDLKAWSDIIIHLHVVLQHLDDEEPREGLVPALNAFLDWLSDLKRSTMVTTSLAGPPPHVLHLACSLLVTIMLANNQRKARSYRVGASDERLHRELMGKQTAITHALCDLLKSVDAVARAAVPSDPLKRAQMAYHQGEILARDHDDVAKVQEAKVYVAQSKGFLSLCKSWLPPAYYRGLKNDLNSAFDACKIFATFLRNPTQGAAVMGRRLKEEAEGVWTAPKSVKSRCAFCEAFGSETRIQLCAQCKQVYYCSVACQKADWKRHKKECKAAAAAAAAEEKEKE